ncbi:MAG: DUF2288 domain-containing protein [Verrucomicrobiae bacterium]|nr:DUF2288 domain-containing protein [Verrucomicrobiae bacterium]
MPDSDSDPMRYAMLGGDPSSPLEKLEKYTGEVDWSYLRPHYENGALVWVDPDLSLTEVGHAVSIDDTDRVQAWKRSGDLVTPSEPHALHWEATGARFLALVVSPFVLIQPL